MPLWGCFSTVETIYQPRHTAIYPLQPPNFAYNASLTTNWIVSAEIHLFTLYGEFQPYRGHSAFEAKRCIRQNTIILLWVYITTQDNPQKGSLNTVQRLKFWLQWAFSLLTSKHSCNTLICNRTKIWGSHDRLGVLCTERTICDCSYQSAIKWV